MYDIVMYIIKHYICDEMGWVGWYPNDTDVSASGYGVVASGFLPRGRVLLAVFFHGTEFAPIGSFTTYLSNPIDENTK